MRVSFAEEDAIILFSSAAQASEQDCACADEGFVALRSSVCEQGETDCACAGDDWMAPAHAPAEDLSATWQIAADIYRAPLPQAHELAITPHAASGVVVLNEAARAILDSFATPRPLAGTAARQLAELGLLQLPGATPAPALSPPKMLTTWLHVTDACNMRCDYCYLAKTGQAMSEATGRVAVDAVFHSAVRHGFRTVKLKYAGGEPTLNFGLVCLLHEHARLQAVHHGLDLREVLLSNGTALSDSMLDFVRDVGMRLMISLDGAGGAHDRQRRLPGGRESSQLVMDAIDRALARGIKPHLSITVTARNAEDVADAVAFALERDLLFNLNFYRPLDPSPSHDHLLTEDAQLITGVRAAFRVIEERLPRQSLIAGLLDRASFGSPHIHACGAGHSYIVIDQRGRVARCQMELGRHLVGDVMTNDPLESVRIARDGFRNVSVQARPECRECTWRYWCAGGCPLMAHHAGKNGKASSPYCDVYRALYPDALRLEGLRLLQWEALPA